MTDNAHEHVALCDACGGSISERAVTPVCASCWERVPARLKCEYIAARYRRQRLPIRYQETLATLLQWCADQRTATYEEERS